VKMRHWLASSDSLYYHGLHSAPYDGDVEKTCPVSPESSTESSSDYTVILLIAETTVKSNFLNMSKRQMVSYSHD